MSRIRIKAVESNYTLLQVTQYLCDIQFPGFSSESNPPVSTGIELERQVGSSGSILSCTLENLETLVQRHLVTFPFENTAMHWYVPDWRTVYQFTLLETYPTDRHALNFAVSERDGHGPFFAHVMAISHFLREGSDTGEMGRMVLFGGRVDMRVGDRSEQVAEVKMDAERITALRTLFGIDIPAGSERYIQGRLAQIV